MNARGCKWRLERQFTPLQTIKNPYPPVSDFSYCPGLFAACTWRAGAAMSEHKRGNEKESLDGGTNLTAPANRRGRKGSMQQDDQMKPPPISIPAALLAISTVIAYQALAVILIFLRPDLDYSWIFGRQGRDR
jgi:hypothetical protein